MSMVCMTIMLGLAAIGAAPLGNIAGYVRDAVTHSPLAGVDIVLPGSNLGIATDGHGYFNLDAVPAGSYTVEASMIGYQRQARTSVVVEPGRTTQLDFYLEEIAISVAGVTVQAEYFTKVKDAPVSERNFSSEEIQAQPGGMGDVSRVVQAMPAVVSTGDGDNEIIVRGGNPNENLFLVDGIELPYPNHFNRIGEQGGGVNMLSPQLIGEINFIAGAFPACYGDRSSSVMDITLKHGQSDGLGANIDMSMAGLGITAEGPLPGNGTFLGSYHKSFLEILVQNGLLGFDIVPDYSNYLGKVEYQLNHRDMVSLVAIFGDDYASAEPGEGVFDEDYAYVTKNSRLAWGLTWQRQFGAAGFGKLLISGARTTWNMVSQEVADNQRGDTIYLENSAEEQLGAHYDATLRLNDKNEIQAGLDATWLPFRHEIFAAPETVFLYAYGPDSTVTDSLPLHDENNDPVVSGLLDINSSAHSYKLGAYVQHRLAVGNAGHLLLGIRSDHFVYTGHTDLSPRAAFMSSPLPGGFSFSLGYGWHFQSPPYHILLWDSIANQDLKSQRSDHYILSVDKLFTRDTKLTTEIYYKTISHQYIPLHWTTADPYDWSTVYLDNGSGRVRGIEVFLQKKLTHHWHGTISYSFSKAQMSNPQNSLQYIPADFDFVHVLTALGAFKIEFRKYRWYHTMPAWIKNTVGIFIFSDEVDIGFRFRFMGGRPYAPFEWQAETRRWIENGDLLNSERMPAYQRFDVRWDHKYIFRNWSLAWYIEVQNVFDRKNLWWYNYMKDGAVEEIEQFRLMPIAGFVIEF